jgi:rhomboid protease GluP
MISKKPVPNSRFLVLLSTGCVELHILKMRSEIFIFGPNPLNISPHSRFNSMENSVAEEMPLKSDFELQTIVANKDRYERNVYIAAIEELDRRNLASADLLQEHAQLTADQQHGEPTAENRKQNSSWRDSLTLLKPNKDYFYTPLIFYSNIAVWIVMVALGVHAVEPSVQDLILWGGNLRSLTLDGQQWRLFTSIFLHGGIFHLLLNMYALLQVGAILEMKFGKHRYFLAYLATGILASVASIAFNDNIVSVGASGAIFGLYGLFLSLLITKSLDIPHEARKAFLSSTAVFIFYNLVFGFAKQGIDNSAHIGGLVSGFVIGFIYYPSIRQPARSILVSSLIAALAVCVVLLMPRFIPNKVAEYRQAMQVFSVNEQKALWMYREKLSDFETASVDRYKERLRTEGVDLWKRNLSLLNDLSGMPPYLQDRVDLLKTYCELRIQICDAVARALTETNSLYNPTINELSIKIEDVIKELEELNK